MFDGSPRAHRYRLSLILTKILLIEIHFVSLLQKTQEALARILKYRNYAYSLLFPENSLPDLDKSVNKNIPKNDKINKV